MGRRDFPSTYIARAYMNADKPDFKAAIQTLTLANERNAEEPQVLLALETYYGDKIKMQLTQLIVMLFKQIIHY
jgi:hypothetical protein